MPPSIIVDRRGGAEKGGRDNDDRTTVAGAEAENFERGREGGGGRGGDVEEVGKGEGGEGGGELDDEGSVQGVTQVSLAGLMSDPERLQQVALGFKVLLHFCTQESHLC